MAKSGKTSGASRLSTPTDLKDKGIQEISKALNGLLADAFAL